jgi:hypothetical protein
MPAGAVYVGRPTRWGNPYVVDVKMALVTSPGGGVVITCADERDARACAVGEFRAYFAGQRMDLSPLRGKDLACFCPLVDKDGNKVPCHADVLLELANAKNV